MEKSFSHIIVLLICIVFTSLFGDEKDSKVSQAWLDGYLKMSQAESLSSAGQPASAAAAYREAIAVLDRIRRDYPHWNPQMIAYRLADCRMKLVELQLRTQGSIETLGVEDLKRQLRVEIEKNERLSEELASLRSRSAGAGITDQVSLLKSELDRLETQLKIEQLKSASRRKQDAENERAKLEIADLLLEKQEMMEAIRVQEEQMRELSWKLKVEQEKVKTLLSQLADADVWAKKGKAIDALKAENDQLQVLVGRLQERVGGYESSERERQVARENKERLQAQALEAEKKADAASAARYWHLLYNKDADDMPAALRASFWYWNADDLVQSKELMDRYFSRIQPQTNQLVMLGRVSLDQNLNDRALALTSLAVASDPGSADARFALGTIYLASGDHGLAERCFLKALEFDKGHKDSLMALALVKASGANIDLKEAKEYYRRAIEAGHPRQPALDEILK